MNRRKLEKPYPWENDITRELDRAVEAAVNTLVAIHEIYRDKDPDKHKLFKIYIDKLNARIEELEAQKVDCI
jgi:hypothetical protein